MFEQLRSQVPTAHQAVSLLQNYDAHAALLRRLLLFAAQAMPEPAVGFILENVRNEYGNGSYDKCHEGQLRDLMELVADKSKIEMPQPRVAAGVREYLKEVVRFYMPGRHGAPEGFYRPAIIAGAITATELMALEEFRAMQVAFRHFGVSEHRWFDHVTVECEHGDESLALADFFITNRDCRDAVEYGFLGTLDCNVSLYSGLLEAVSERDFSLLA